MECTCPILDRSVSVHPTAYSKDTWNVVRCDETGFVFLANPPDYAELATDFAWEKTSREERERRVAEEPLWSRLSSAIKHIKRTTQPGRNKTVSIVAAESPQRSGKTLRVVDIGCGRAKFLTTVHQRLKQRGQAVEPIGIEVSEQLAEQATQRIEPIGGRVLLTNALEAMSRFDSESIDVVAMISFLEHEARPLPLLRKLHRALCPDGIVVLKVPNFNCWNRFLRGRKWCGFRYPDHVNYFTAGTLSRLAKEAGFYVARQRLLDRSPLSDNMYAVLRRAELRNAGVRKAA